MKAQKILQSYVLDDEIHPRRASPKNSGIGKRHIQRHFGASTLLPIRSRPRYESLSTKKYLPIYCYVFNNVRYHTCHYISNIT